ncbi:DUF3549 family protein [Shewanella gelidii]|uniref:DUF3549 family protein n=1 Tax=Shewanella gelidii TaxID=1642821 RepID=A0A917JKA5_9GAMM|nr:DUF3549 family protein [Shewanella gelidii]MCL1097304.1 DUF3549 family protein [Shewanella gelidii]GGI74055.1 hypothetical protein GCM10009332_09460 [Shewanella gelidii]
MAEITTLSQFLTTANTQFQVYDLGRRIQHIDMMAFHQIEALTSPYPHPIQGHAQFAVVFWDESQQHYIWFLKLPLDERGLLNPAARTQFIKMVVEALGSDPTLALSEEQQDKLSNHPFAFKPTQEKLAVFNALVKKQLGLRASAQYEFAYQYLSGQIAPDMWQKVGLQGIADICVRAEEFDHLEQLCSSLDTAALEVQIALCQCFEHLSLAPRLIEKLAHKFETATPEMRLYYFRALACSATDTQRAIAKLEQDNALDAEALVTIAARNWTALKDDASRKIFLEALAKQDQLFFNQIFADVVAIPLIRTLFLAELRNPERSVTLSTAIGGLFKRTQ